VAIRVQGQDRSAHIPDYGQQRRELVIWGAHRGAGITTLDDGNGDAGESA
jgi:hypothetical protein